MAVFEYRGILVATGKQVHGVRDADNPKVAPRALEARGHPAHRARSEEKRQARRAARAINFGAFFSRVSRQRRRDDDAPARDARRRRHPARRVGHARSSSRSRRTSCKRVLTQRARRPERRHSPREGARGAPQGLPAALREHGRRGRGLGHARDGARAARRLHGEPGAAPRQGHRRARLSGAHAHHRHRSS